MSASVYVGVSAISRGTTTASVAWPAGHRPRDLALLLIECSSLHSTAKPRGWSHVAGSPLVEVASAAGSKFQLLWKRASSSAEAALSLPDLGDHTVACIAVFRGGPLGGNPFSVVSTLLKSSASCFASTPAIVTTQGDGGGFGLWTGLRAVPAAVGVSGGFQNTVTTNCAYTLALPRRSQKKSGLYVMHAPGVSGLDQQVALETALPASVTLHI